MNLTSDRWAGVFYAVAGFNNVGMSLLDASVVNFLSSFSSFLLIPLEIPFQRSVFFLTIMGILMLAGNTA
jgi:Trk-type K+ transport system membrane component